MKAAMPAKANIRTVPSAVFLSSSLAIASRRYAGI